MYFSGVTHEIGIIRDALENKVEMKDCFAGNQPGVPNLSP